MTVAYERLKSIMFQKRT